MYRYGATRRWLSDRLAVSERTLQRYERSLAQSDLTLRSRFDAERGHVIHAPDKLEFYWFLLERFNRTAYCNVCALYDREGCDERHRVLEHFIYTTGAYPADIMHLELNISMLLDVLGYESTIRAIDALTERWHLSEMLEFAEPYHVWKFAIWRPHLFPRLSKVYDHRWASKVPSLDDVAEMNAWLAASAEVLQRLLQGAAMPALGASICRTNLQRTPVQKEAASVSNGADYVVLQRALLTS